MNDEPQEDTNPRLVKSNEDSLSQEAPANQKSDGDGWSYEESYVEEQDKASSNELTKSEDQSRTSQDAETKKFETELDTAQDQIQATVEKVTKTLKPKDLGQLIVKLDSQMQRSNNQIVSPRLEALDTQRADDLKFVGLNPDATPRQIKVAFNEEMINLRKLFDATSNKTIDPSLQNKFNALQEAFTRLRENNYQQTSKIVKTLENQERLLIQFEDKASVVRPLKSKEEAKITALQESTKDLLTTATDMNTEAQEVTKELTALIVDPRIDVGLKNTKEIVSQVTPETINQALPKLASSITQTNTALQASAQKVTDATNIFVQLGYTGTFDNLTALRKFYRSKAIRLHPDKQDGKADEEKNENEENFKKLSTAFEILANPEEIKSLTSAIEGQQRLLIEFKNKVDQENIPLTEEQKTTIDTFEQKSISTQELRMLDMEKRFEAAAIENAKAVQDHSVALLVNFQNQIRKITEQTLEPALAKIPEILSPSFFSVRNAARTVDSRKIEDIVTSDIQNEIITPYTTAIKDLYNPETLKSMIPDDQKALNKSYQKALDAYKEKLLTTLEKYRKEKIPDQKLTSLINDIEIKLGLKTEDVGYASWQEPEKKSSKYDSKIVQQKLTDL